MAEASGLGQGIGAYLLRSLISEGRLRHATVDTSQGLQGKIIEREGPSGLLVTTTATNLDAELETRLFSVPIDDSPEQTARIMQSIGKQATGEATRRPLDLTIWHSLQLWLELAEHRVVVPFGHVLASAIPPKALRLRRDFGSLIALIKAHAMLHQATRTLDATGCIVATVEDYGAVRELVHDLIAEGVEASVSSQVRETVLAVKRLKPKHLGGVSLRALATELELDKSSASRRVTDAVERGFLRNEEEKQGKAARLFTAEPLPEEVELLPFPEILSQDRCSVARCKGERPSLRAVDAVGTRRGSASRKIAA